jgi:anti-sigma regulatory factor (Ser/Thr protein kinase)
VREEARHVAVEQERRFAAEPSTVTDARHWVISLAEEMSFSEFVPDLALAVSEAVANAVRHTSSDSVMVRWVASADEATVEVADEGMFKRRAVSPDGQSGLGLPLMAAVMDEVSIARGSPRRAGTRVRLVKRKG